MNWKEKLKGQFGGYKNATELPKSELEVPSHLNEFRKEIESFISTEIIEKLIADIPGTPVATKADIDWGDGKKRVAELKQQLRDKWL